MTVEVLKSLLASLPPNTDIWLQHHDGTMSQLRTVSSARILNKDVVILDMKGV